LVEKNRNVIQDILVYILLLIAGVRYAPHNFAFI